MGGCVVLITFGCLALALLVLPGLSPATARVAALRDRGRLAPVAAEPGDARRSWRVGPRLRAVAVPVGVTVLTAFGWQRAGPAVGLAAGVLSGTAWWLARAVLRRRHEQTVRAEHLAALRLLAGELAAGGSVPAALEAAASASSGVRSAAFLAAAAEARAGTDPGGVLAGTDLILARLAVAWRVAEVGGAPLAEVFAHCAEDLGAEVEQRRAIAVAASGPRSSALMMAGLPVLGLGLGALMGAQPLGFLFGSSGGRLVLAVGVLLDAAGMVWTQRLLARAEVTS